MNEEKLKTRLTESFPKADIAVSGDGYHFEAVIVDAQFAGLTRMQRHRLVYDIVRAEITSGQLHALSLKTLSPEEQRALSNP